MGPYHNRPGRHLGAVGKQSTSSGSGRDPGCSRGARLSAKAQCHLPGHGVSRTSNSLFNLRWSQGERFQTIGQKRLGVGQGLAGGLCAERMVPGREADGWSTLGEATDLWEPAGQHCRGGWNLRCERERAGVPEALPCRDRTL